MFPARRSADRRRRRRGPLAAGAVALGAGAASVLFMAPAQAGTPVRPPVPLAAAHPEAPSAAQLRAAVAQAVTASRSRTHAAFSATSSASATPIDPKVIGGTTTTITTAPWMVQLWYDDEKGTPDDFSDDDAFFCGGVVIAPTKIITAGHCVAGAHWDDVNSDGTPFGVAVTGTDQLPTTNTDGSADLHGGTVSGVWRQWSHPSFNSVTLDDDVAVLTLDAPVTATPLPLAAADDTADYAVGTAATVYGWGRTSSTSQDLSQTLREATLPIDAASACTAAYGTQFVAAHQVCAGPPATGTDAGTVGVCSGDSGGPLVVRGRLVGVVSAASQDCVTQGTYSVFTKVSAYDGAVLPRVYDGNVSGDDKADLFAVTSGGEGYLYVSTGSNFETRQDIGSFAGLNMVRQADLDLDDFGDLLERTTDGQLYFLSGAGAAPYLVGPGWNIYPSIVVPGDLNGDGWPDLVGTDSSGVSWFYAGNGKGAFAARVKIGSGWNIYNGAIYGVGDLSGDGRPDIVARDGSGVLWLYKGTGSAPAVWAARTTIGSGWGTYTAFAATGDITGDGHADLLARDSGGTMWLYDGTGSAAAPYSARVKIGAGWNGYTLFG
jgi:hypothetical protein